MRIALDDTTLFFDVDGAKLVPNDAELVERPALVLLHGGPGGDHSYFKSFLGPLRESMQIVYLDQRGQGRSDRVPAATRRLRTWAEDVRRVCELLGIEHPIVLGCSFGSFVALRYAIDQPDHPLAVILLATAGTLDPDDIAAGFGRRGGPQAAALARQAFGGSVTPEEWASFLAGCGSYYTMTAHDSGEQPVFPDAHQIAVEFLSGGESLFDLRPDAHRVCCPTLIVNGAEDPVTTAGAARELAEALPGELTRLEILPGVAHDLARDAPRRTRRLIAEFVREVWATRGDPLTKQC